MWTPSYRDGSQWLLPRRYRQRREPRASGAFLRQEDAGYRVRKEIRDLPVFATHNLLAHPPFSKLDLLSCRNLLIYLEGIEVEATFPRVGRKRLAVNARRLDHHLGVPGFVHLAMEERPAEAR